MWKGKSMTEKSEDQVWVCQKTNSCFPQYTAAHTCDSIYNSLNLCTGELIPYIPHSKYLALKYDLAVAVETLEVIASSDTWAVSCEPLKEFITMTRLTAKEALGKIGGGK